MKSSLCPGLCTLSALVLSTLVAPNAAQAVRPQPYAITNVSLDRTGEDEARWTILLRDGRIEAIQPAEVAIPPGVRRLDGEGAIALPAFVDAYTHEGCETPEPVKDQDHPLDEESDVRIDMREANRKGIEPAFRAATVLAIDEDATKAWHEAGFATAYVCPHGELLAGNGVVASVRDAAARDLVITPELFGHAAFQATGPGYPSTLMGYVAQLRQFFLDARRQDALEKRRAAGKDGLRPPFDDELEAGVRLLGGSRRLACAAEKARDIERWQRLAGEFDLALAVTGGKEAWRVAEDLASADVPVILTLDWGEEVPDPFAKEGEGEEAAEIESPPEEGVTPDARTAAEGEEAGKQSEEEASKETEEEAGPAWEYEEPLGVRAERRRLWEEDRDCALRLNELGIPFAFGTSGVSPAKLLERVRTLVEVGLPSEAALEALTAGAARLLGLEDRLGALAPDHDATLCLCQGDPFTDAKARVSWIFVDGYPTELEAEAGL